MTIKDVTGVRYGNLVVLSLSTPSKAGRVRWLCQCDCGNKVVVQANNLQSGNTISCGCKGSRAAHGPDCYKATHYIKDTDPLYIRWIDMKKRCYNPNCKRYADWGGRGIKICPEWEHDFKAFYDWAYANGYNNDLSIDRIDNNGDYSPDNCRWVTVSDQNNNTRRNIRITYEGETHTLIEWCRIYDRESDYETIRQRYHAGWVMPNLFKPIKRCI